MQPIEYILEFLHSIPLFLFLRGCNSIGDYSKGGRSAFRVFWYRCMECRLDTGEVSVMKKSIYFHFCIGVFGLIDVIDLFFLSSKDAWRFARRGES